MAEGGRVELPNPFLDQTVFKTALLANAVALPSILFIVLLTSNVKKC